MGDGDRKKVRTVVLQEALAKQDAEQAKEIRGWAKEIERARDLDDAPAHDEALRALEEKMRRTADTVETYATELLKRLESEASR